MKRIGLTGNIGTGKSTVSRIFESLGVDVYNADNQARKFLNSESVIQQIGILFGNNLINSNQEIDRKALASIVFADKNKLEELNRLIHPMVKADFEKLCDMHKDAPYLLHEAAILFESGFSKFMDANILVTAPEELCISRVIKRDGVSEQMVRQRMQNQWTQERKTKLSDYLIVNDEIKLIIPQVVAIHEKLLSGN